MTNEVKTSLEADISSAEVVIPVAPIEIPIGKFDGEALLRQVIEREGYPAKPTGKQLQALAEKLRQFAPQDKPVKWNRDYLDNVLHARRGFDNPAPLIHAMRGYLALQGGVPEIWAKSTPVSVNVAGGVIVEAGALLNTPSRICINPVCHRPYIPRSGNQKYCHVKCRDTANNRNKSSH